MNKFKATITVRSYEIFKILQFQASDTWKFVKTKVQLVIVTTLRKLQHLF